MRKIFIITLLLGVIIFNLSLAVRTTLGRDEHQFVAGAYLIAKEGLSPYSDFPHIHLPYLILIEALLFQLTTHYLLAARFFSALCGAGVVLVVFFLCRGFFSGLSSKWQYSIAFGGVLLLIGNPLYVFTVGLAWNHSLASFLALLSFAVYLWAAKYQKVIGWIFLSGLILGMSIGTRSSYITLLPALMAGFFIYPGTRAWKKTRRLILALGLGVVLALLPALYYYFAAPKEFVFGNLEYHALNTTFRLATNYDAPITLVERITYYWESVIAQPGNFALLMGLMFFGLSAAFLKFWNLREPYFEIVMLLGAIPCVLAGSFLPSPSWYQYFYAPVPFVVLALTYGLSLLIRDSNSQLSKWLMLLFVQLVLLVSFYRFSDYRRVTFLLHPETWRPIIMHELGEKVRDVVNDGKILTITPIIPIEAGLDIYPEMNALGIFRVSPLLSPIERKELGIMAGSDLEERLSSDPPAGILVGLEPYWEQPLLEFAQKHGYSQVVITNDVSLWIPAP